MARAPFQVLVFPYHLSASKGARFALFARAQEGFWQGIAGGGEVGESPLAAAQRESFEEAGIPPSAFFLPLDSVSSIPVIHFKDHPAWGNHRYVIPEYAFGVAMKEETLRLSHEHREACWVSYEEAVALVRYDSNRTALWELHQRLKYPSPNR